MSGRGVANEAALVKQIQSRIKKEFPTAWVVKVVGNPYQVSGIPDLLVLHEGHLFAFEVKHQKIRESEEHARARASEIQLRTLEKIRKAGGVAAVVLSSEEVLKYMEE